MHVEAKLNRADTLRCVRLHHLTFSLSSLFWGTGGPGFEGTWSSGEYGYHNGSGDHFGFSWDETTLVGLVFFHESRRSQWNVEHEARDPYLHLGEFSADARKLAEVALTEGFMSERLVSAGFYADDKQAYMNETWSEGEWHGYRAFERFRLTPDAAMLGQKGQNWHELSSLSEGQAKMLIEVSDACEAGGMTLSSQQREVLLAPIEGRAFDAAELEDVAASFTAAGVRGLV